ncbi:hypothetical protein [Plantibacter flavus]|uniref:Uncharacterized protein n=1 Tax=Plantibacter flavus TaxID=150123 RepID=A0A3N2BYT2_9MICO|nr:hypothetical protein [Plantibacter flavus]ROR80363.1 hypothetical protein EDD42_0404 [Plantibacter flavus]
MTETATFEGPEVHERSGIRSTRNTRAMCSPLGWRRSPTASSFIVVGRPTFAGYSSIEPVPPSTAGNGMKPTLSMPIWFAVSSFIDSRIQLPCVVDAHQLMRVK